MQLLWRRSPTSLPHHRKVLRPRQVPLPKRRANGNSNDHNIEVADDKLAEGKVLVDRGDLEEVEHHDNKMEEEAEVVLVL